MNQRDIDIAARDMIGNLLRARAFLKRCDLATVENLRNAAAEVAELKKVEAREEAIKLQKINKEKDALVTSIKEFCAEHDISYDDFINSNTISDHTKAKAKDTHNTVRYRVEAFGRIYDWKGSGIMPVVIRAALSQMKCATKAAILMPDEADHYITTDKLDFSIAPEYLEEVTALAAKYDTDHKKPK
jgi:DNA-binding protein H-NS